MINVKNISVRFGKKKVLNNLSIEFYKGEIIGLVAPNGTGKTTLLNVLMNYLTPQKGHVEIGGQCYSSKKDQALIHRKITMMPNQSDLYNHLTGLDHLKIYQSMWSETSLKPVDVYKRLKMEHYIKDRVETYSLGMRQRLCLAMQIVANTPYMLMDEVMNGLDSDNVELISKLLEEKKAESKVIIIASHLLENLEKYADRVYFLKGGKFIFTRDSESKLTEPIYFKFPTRNQNVLLKDIKEIFPHFSILNLSNEMTIIPLENMQAKELDRLATLVIDEYQTAYHVGPLTLSDYYSLHYGDN